jgi:hypothetical protein
LANCLTRRMSPTTIASKSTISIAPSLIAIPPLPRRNDDAPAGEVRAGQGVKTAIIPTTDIGQAASWS